MEILTATNKKNVSAFNKCIKALTRYNVLNNLREKSENDGERETVMNRHDRACESAFDRYQDYLSELPKYEQKRIENSELYLYN